MNTHNSDIFTPASIATVSRLYFKVPLYQRLFAWSETEVKGLLGDLEYHFDKAAKDSMLDKAYYLGVVTTVEDGETLCLVDGQQRLTVLMIMAAQFSHYSEHWKRFFDHGNRLELFAREDDALYLKSLADSTIKTSYTNRLMETAYHVVEQFIEKMADEKIREFIANCFDHITLFNSRLPKEYLQNPSSLNKYFEVMNSSGVNLEQHEVLKVKLLKGQSEHQHLLRIWNMCADFSKPLLRRGEDVDNLQYATDYSNLFLLALHSPKEVLDKVEARGVDTQENNQEKENCTIAEIPIKAHTFNKIVPEERERSVITFSEFLLLTLDLYLRKHGKCGHKQNLWAFYKTDCLIERFETFLPKDAVTGFYAFMLTMRIALDVFVIRKTFDDQDSRYSLVCREENSKREHLCLKQYEAMMTVSTSYYKWLPELLDFCTSADEHNMRTTHELLSFIKAWDNKQHPMPSNHNELAYGSIDRYWFWRLDYCLWENMAFPEKDSGENEPTMKAIFPYKQAILDYTFKSNRSIEHLHPQNQSNNDLWDFNTINSFGNLAMISQSFNSLQSNEDVHVKFARIEIQARKKMLQSIKMLYMYLEAKGNPDEWSPIVAERHGKEMIELLEKSYL